MFNRAAFLENETITFRAERLDGDFLDTITWHHLSIAPGDSELLPTALVFDSLPIYDLRLILDPENIIEETEEGELNNVFETPVLMRVEFTELAAYPCETTGVDSEQWFLLSAGHGTSLMEVQWVGGLRRYPYSGTAWLDLYRDAFSEDPDWWAHWHPSEEEPARFIIEFEMPPDENLYIMGTGYENDFWDDDFLGRVDAEYGPEVNYGHRDEVYRGQSPDQGCDEAAPISWDYFGMEMWWRITRVQ